MIGYKQAKKIALDILNPLHQTYNIVLFEPGIDIEYGWIFYYDQEGVFHPKLHEIQAKIDLWLKRKKTEDEINKLLTPKEHIILSNSVGLVGRLPLFIDKETSKEMFIQGPTEAIKQEILEIKTGKRFKWKVYITDSIKENIDQFKAIQRISMVDKAFILKTIHSNKPISETNSIRQILLIKKILTEASIDYKVEIDEITTMKKNKEK